jgi:hypothetical protein
MPSHFDDHHLLHTIRLPHGNDKSENPRQCRRTLPSTIADIRNKGTEKQPSKIYKGEEFCA